MDKKKFNLANYSFSNWSDLLFILIYSYIDKYYSKIIKFEQMLN